MRDVGLAVLRAAEFLLAFTFGAQKTGWYIAALRDEGRSKPCEMPELREIVEYLEEDFVRS